MANPSPESRELELLRKVELRIGLADTDEKLSKQLMTYLSPVLLKLASEHMSVRNKVISICQHISTRIQPKSIQLPVAALLKQFKENAATPLIRHFDLIYIREGITRLSRSERLELFPTVIQDISKNASAPTANSTQLFYLLVWLICQLPLPARGTNEDLELRTKLAISSEDAEFLAFWFGKLVLLNIVPRASMSPETLTACPGLSVKEYQFLTTHGQNEVFGPTPLFDLNIIESRVKIARFLASGVFKDEERFLPAVFASADRNSNISDVGDDILKRSISSIDLEDPKLVDQLYGVYLGNRTTEGPRPARPALRVKLLSLLSKSVASTKFSDKIAIIVEEGLASPTNAMGEPSSDTSSRLETTKLRSATLAFAKFVVQRGAGRDIRKLAEGFVSRFQSFVLDQGWPSVNADEDWTLRRYAYEVIGESAKASKSTNLKTLSWLFQSLREDTSGVETAVGIEEAISNVMANFSGSLDDTVRSSLAQLLLDNMQPNGQKRSSRYVAVRFANRCLPYHDVDARLIDILAIGAESTEPQEVADEGGKGLDPSVHQMMHAFEPTTASTNGKRDDTDFPDFAEFTQNAFQRLYDFTGENIQQGAALTKRFQQERPKSFSAFLQYSQILLYNGALSSSNILKSTASNWTAKLESTVSNDGNARKAIREYTEKLTNQGKGNVFALQILLQGSMELLLSPAPTQSRSNDNQVIFSELCTFIPNSLLSAIAPAFRTLEVPIISNNYTTRLAASQAYGVLISSCASNPQFSKQPDIHASLAFLLQILRGWKSAVGAEENKVHGAIVALGYATSRLIYKTKDATSLGTLVDYLSQLFLIFEQAKSTTIQDGILTAFGQMWFYYVVSPESLEEYMPVESLINKVFETAKKGNEKAIVALGRLSMILQEPSDGQTDSNLNDVAEKFYSLHEIKQIETHFTVGEALSCLACGWESTVLASEHNVDGPFPVGPDRKRMLAIIFDKVLRDCKTTKPSLRKASVIWLLCLIQFCGHRQEVQDRLRQSQAAFAHCLSDRDELVQEAASRGLSIVYEKGDRALKDDLVSDLVRSFTGDRAQLAGNVTEDTQLFEEGDLPTGDGSVTTYKDILSLASEVGDSSMVYRFMALASNNAIWSSRAAFGRFGLSSVFSDSSVEGYLAENPKLYPKLFRYRFDPNTNVRRSMNDIWNALVKDSAATTNKHFDAIMEDLLISILGKEWRAREASCAAIADLIQSQKFELYEDYLSRIWAQCFKVLDDIKGSVRKAAASLARVLTGVLTRSLEAGTGKNAEAMLKDVLPFLLSHSGIESRAQDVQMFSLETLLKIIKKSSAKTLRPFIPELVEKLIALFSSLQSGVANYLRMKASEHNITEQDVDDHILSGVRSSPLMEAVERCLDLLDDDTMKELVPRLENAMKTAIDLPSKVACARILSSFSTRHNLIFRPYADRFLKSLERRVTDRNDTVSKAYAESAGYVSRLASDDQILKMFEFSKKIYFEAEEDRNRITSGDIVHAISKHATDRFNSFASEFFPFVYVAKQDSHEHVKELFESTWNENVGGSRAVMLYLGEIVSLAQNHLDSPKWALKHAAARAVSEATTALAAPTDGINKVQAATLWPALVKAMAGKTWEGKETVLKAFVRFVEKAPEYWKSDDKVSKDITVIIVREAKRQNVDYRQYALRALGQVAKARMDIDMSTQVFDIVGKVMEELADVDADAMQIDGGEAAKSERL
ncbi:ARM repeat-containing protein [Aulographum hederae CBS 113979]|uniref:ARM repeat-containing protein n=1 Tax=Aulographum hederae CBS 113979 TaxID=1176131 RepID=A0A6G1GUN8_9PEZI|nr:ARM repeat-containing protein [Aulographum hederae CBS 113979]